MSSPFRPAAVAVAVAAAVLAVPAPARADTWRAVTASPGLWPRHGFQGVAATGPDDVWAVGYQGYQAIDWSIEGFGAGSVQILPRKPALRRWDGSSWKRHDPPNFTGPGVLRNVSAASRSNVWIAGLRTDAADSPDVPTTPYLARWDGSKWHETAVPEGCGSGEPVASGGGAWLNCGAEIARWDAGRWTLHQLGATAGRISAPSPDEAWAVTYQGLYRWDGTAWRRVPEAPRDLNDVLARSADDVRVTGHRDLDDGSGRRERFTMHWDGARWREVPAAPGRMYGVRGGPLWSFGTYSHIHRWDGAQWVRETLDRPAGEWAEMTGLAAVPGTAAAWMVGRNKNEAFAYTGG